MPQPLPNPRTLLWCCAVHLSQSAHASRPPARVPLSPGYAPASGCAASHSSISVPYRAFFRLSGLVHQRFIPLKARVLIQDGMVGITQRFVIGNLLVMDLARVGLTQVADPRGLGINHHHILVAVGLALATLGQSLFFWALRALAAAVRAINDQFRRLPFAAFVVSE